MFIDEGFGTLDDEGLDAVIDALDRLREADRLVGVITHVAQLAERIPDGLRVEQRGGGSVISRRDAGRVTELAVPSFAENGAVGEFRECAHDRFRISALAAFQEPHRDKPIDVFVTQSDLEDTRPLALTST